MAHADDHTPVVSIERPALAGGTLIFLAEHHEALVQRSYSGDAERFTIINP